MNIKHTLHLSNINCFGFKMNCFSKKLSYSQWYTPEFLNNNRVLLMGVAIILIILYHAYCVLGGPFIFFKYGYIGVDIFLLLAAFGLSYSYTKNTFGKFYLNRLKRIYPLYFICLSYATLSLIIRGEDVTLLDYICNITGLSYYKIGGQILNWYLNAYLLFCFIFPLLFYLVKRLRIWAVFIVTIIVFGVYFFFEFYQLDMNWRHSCFVGRIPVFVFGLWLWFNNGKPVKDSLLMVLAILGMVAILYVDPFLGAALICPLFVKMISVVYRCMIMKRRYYRFLEYHGTSSLELYVANGIAIDLCLFVIENLSLTRWGKLYLLLPYFILTYIIAYYLCKYNRSISTLWK